MYLCLRIIVVRFSSYLFSCMFVAIVVGLDCGTSGELGVAMFVYSDEKSPGLECSHEAGGDPGGDCVVGG